MKRTLFFCWQCYTVLFRYDISNVEDIQPIVLWNAKNKMVPKKKRPWLWRNQVKCQSFWIISVSPLMNHKWSTHINYICKTFSQRLGKLRRIRHNLTNNARLAFYSCLPLSLMDYCCVVWGNTSKGNLDRIPRWEKSCQTDVRSGIQSSLRYLWFLELGWFLIHDRITLMHATIFFKEL